MPLTRAKAPISSRKSLFATTVRTKRRTSQKNSQADGSYLQVGSDNATASASSHKFISNSQVSCSSDSNQAILSALTRLEAANQDLSCRMDRMDRDANTNSTPVQSSRPRETLSFNLPQGSRLGRDSSPIAPQRTHSQVSHECRGRQVPGAHHVHPTQICIPHRFLSPVIA